MDAIQIFGLSRTLVNTIGQAFLGTLFAQMSQFVTECDFFLLNQVLKLPFQVAKWSQIRS